MGYSAPEEIEDDDIDVSNGSNEDFVSYNGNKHEELMFLQSDDNSAAKQTSCSKQKIPLSWILLDSQSTIDVFCNGDLLSQIYHSDTDLIIRCNAGVKRTNMRGHLSGYGWVWYFPEGIANILSLSRVKERFRVTFDSAVDNCFQVHKTDGNVLIFKEANRRLIILTQRRERTLELCLLPL